jgi:peptidoglycan/LPS O-acetylase OafA/YrhL
MLQLDILRGIAILLVLQFHMVIFPGQAGRLWRVAGPLKQIGWSGVDLFFVLSGFLIGGLLFQELRVRGEVDVRRFIIRRGFKIWPSYLLYIAVVFVLVWFLEEGALLGAGKKLWPNFLHVQNYFEGPRGHTWSLAVEEHFYLALPLLLLLLTFRQRGRLTAVPALPWVALGVFAGCLALRLAIPVHGSTQEEFQKGARWTHYYPTHLRIDGLFFGVLLAYFYHFHPSPLQRLARWRVALLVVCVVLVAPLAFFPLQETPWVSTIGYTMAYLGYGCLLLVVVHTPLGEGWLGRLLASWPSRVVAFIGVYSYPIYLWHIDAAQVPLQHLFATSATEQWPAELRWLLATFACAALATVAGVVMGTLVERPALALRDRLFPSRSEALGSAVKVEVAPRPADAAIPSSSEGTDTVATPMSST